MTTQEAMTRARALVAQMTVEEQASQLRFDAPAIERLGIPAYNWWNEALHGVARAGTATVFPQAIALAAMFSQDGMEDIADAIATEGRAKYNMARAHGDRGIYKGLTFWSPNVNIFRDPRWGRGQETYGEDPYLTARLGVRFVRGLQGRGRYLKAAACAKHMAVHSGPERLRHEFDAHVSEKDLRETYLPAFEALVKEAGVEAVMGAYNRFEGEPCCASRRLMVDILRGEWGFEGHFVSDCGAIADFHMHHLVTATAPESAALALKRGCDLNCGVTYLHLLQAYQDGLISAENIARAAERVMATRIKLGMMDDDCEYDRIGFDACDCDAHADKALQAARRSMVLLQNDGVLPLHADALRCVAIVGPNADSQAALEGNYNGKSSRFVTPLQALRTELAGKARVIYARGCELTKERSTPESLPGDRIAEAVAAAEAADVTILCLGLDATIEGEEGDAGDKRDLELPACQRRLLEAVCKVGKPVVTVVFAGSALRVEEGNAVLMAWYPGQAGGTALCDLLFGRVSPSGRLPVTFYRSVDDLPPFEDYAMAGRTYRYFTGEPLYPFGYGLSYARFVYSDAAVEDGALWVSVQNVGAMDAEEVVQVYIKAEDSPYSPPNPRLCAFARVRLAAGEKRRVALELAPEAFTVVDETGARVRPGGTYSLYVGGSQPDARSARLTGERPLRIQMRG